MARQSGHMTPSMCEHPESADPIMMDSGKQAQLMKMMKTAAVLLIGPHFTTVATSESIAAPCLSLPSFLSAEAIPLFPSLLLHPQAYLTQFTELQWECGDGGVFLVASTLQRVS